MTVEAAAPSWGGLERANAWFASLGREPFPFQYETWAAYAHGESGLILAPTGMGKTLAAALGPMIEALDADGKQSRGAPPFTVLWLTPLRALATDTANALTEAATAMGLNWTVGLRTSDTTATVRKKQKERLPTVLVTTPESLSLLLSYADGPERLASVKCVVADEWHELMGTKRGVQAELGIARLRTLNPSLRVWGISATIGNLDDAAATLLGPSVFGKHTAVRAPDGKAIELRTLLPETIERFPWAGHLGTRMVEPVAAAIEQAGTTLVFTNTRSQSELWFKNLLAARPGFIGKIAVHHGSVDRKLRQRVEEMLKVGELRAVVCTSSLDLGVDFWPVDQVIQIGSPKGVARAMQRAGRSGHRPGQTSRLTCVPTQALELVEYSATRLAIERRMVESRLPIELPLDVLAQHLVTVAAGGGFDEAQLLHEVRTTHAFANLTDDEWRWTLDFAHRGGQSLTAYPQFARITKREEDGRWVVATDQIARMHRMNVGTITSDGTVALQFVAGKRLGTVEESFIARLKPGDKFSFAGRTVAFVRIHEMVAQVRLATSKSGLVPRWGGGRLPMSTSLAIAMRQRLEEAADGNFVDEEMRHVRPILDTQARQSLIPRARQLLIETSRSPDGIHHFLYPFQGRLAHEGLAALLAYRLSRLEENGGLPVTATFNDYGIELLSTATLADTAEKWLAALRPENLTEDVLLCLNTSELAKRHFREIARVAGLLIATRPGAPKSARQLQASSGLFYDVFNEFDPGNLLLHQAKREVLENQLELSRLRSGLEQVATQDLTLVTTTRFSPLAFPLFAERIGSQQLRSESASQRIERLAAQLERAAEREE